MTEYQLFLFLAEVTVLVAVARIGGEVAVRLGLPLVMGELAFGIMLGPSLLGWVWPSGFEALFPADVLQRSLLEIVSWIGIIVLVLLSGLETRFGLLRHNRRAVLGSWIGGFGIPFAAGFVLGMLFPAKLIPAGVDQAVFALFLATAMAISAIPVIARILMDLNLHQTRVGAIIMSSAIVDDTIGWIVLAVVAGLAGSGLEMESILRTLLLTGGFVVIAGTVGYTVVREALRLSARLRVPYAQLSTMLLIVFAFGALTQWIGVHLVLGAFVASTLIGRAVRHRRAEPAAIEGVRQVGMALFIPFFFAYVGIKVDLTTLHGDALVLTIVAVLVACASKVIGGGFGARVGGLPGWEAAAVGFGRNARGAMELVIAAIGLSLGILTEAVYAMIVLIAVLTTLLAAPMLAFCMERAGHTGLRDRYRRGALPLSPAAGEPLAAGAASRSPTAGGSNGID